jgi:integrase
MAERSQRMLTERKIERAKPGRYSDGHGLYLIVHNANNKSFAYRWERDGHERWMGLGPTHTVSLKMAREKARAARLLRLEGIDPLEQRKAAKAAHALAVAKLKTFKECAEDYIAANRDGWKNARHGQQWIMTLATYVYPKIGNLPVGSIDTGLVLSCVEPIWRDKTETASRVRGRIEAILDWATVRKYRQGDNPARWRGHLQHVLLDKGKIAKVEHHAALPYAQLPPFMAELRQREGTAARALEFTILCAARTGETLGAEWSEIDLANKIWTVPAGRMKTGVEHHTALSQRAIELLRSLPVETGNNTVFLGPRGDKPSRLVMSRLLSRMGCDVSVHGFRSTFRSWAAECTNYPREVCELALAHKVGSKVERAYQRGQLLAKRFALAEAWAKYCSSPPAEKSDKVVSLHA